jgi:hypothetical protein
MNVQTKSPSGSDKMLRGSFDSGADLVGFEYYIGKKNSSPQWTPTPSEVAIEPGSIGDFAIQVNIPAGVTCFDVRAFAEVYGQGRTYGPVVEYGANNDESKFGGGKTLAWDDSKFGGGGKTLLTIEYISPTSERQWVEQ